ncbi:A/G-specific adenine glycosylase [Oikeobacillus pervagus]|nr:A/G-specific adenine glycosylase [Oikeobacillus pervagus]
MKIPNIEHLQIESFQQDLVGWYEKEKRDLPWRKSKDPYKIWVSEVMLQQTRVDTVIPYYERFMEKYPTIDTFAKAEDEEVLKIWEGLGYYSRVRNLHSAVKEVKERYGSKVPDTLQTISTLKGVGPYTAGAVLSIAYNQPEPAVDGNVMRVISRILSIWDDIAKPSSRKIFEEAVRKLIYEQDPSSFNQALMELGALICTPTSPSCLLCPVRDHCCAFQEGVQTELPVKTRKKKVRHLHLFAIVLKKEGEFLIHKRDETGLLANLWEFPNAELSELLSPKEQMMNFLQDEYGIDAKIETGVFTKIQHVFSHLVWDIDVYAGEMMSEITESTRLKLVNKERLIEFAFPVSHQKIWREYQTRE